MFKRYFWEYVSGVIESIRDEIGDFLRYFEQMRMGLIESIRDEIMLKVAVVNMMFVGGV